jgi:hypothetical protein
MSRLRRVRRWLGSAPPPPQERSLADELKYPLGLGTGVTIGGLLLDGAHPVLRGVLAAAVALVVGLAWRALTRADR